MWLCIFNTRLTGVCITITVLVSLFSNQVDDLSPYIAINKCIGNTPECYQFVGTADLRK